MLDVDKKKNKKGNGSYLGEVLSKEVIFESKEVRHEKEQVFKHNFISRIIYCNLSNSTANISKI